MVSGFSLFMFQTFYNHKNWKHRFRLTASSVVFVNCALFARHTKINLRVISINHYPFKPARAIQDRLTMHVAFT